MTEPPTPRVPALLLILLLVQLTLPTAHARATRPADPTPWGIELVHGSPDIQRTAGGAGVDVAVLDTGVDRDHPDLAGRVERCMDFTGDDPPRSTCRDLDGHGTHVAGTILADAGPDDQGLWGVAPQADLWALRVCQDDGACRSTDLREAIRFAADQGAEVITMSLGGQPDPHLQRALQYAHDRGALLVAAAGNRGPNLATMDYPGADELAVGVGAIERVDPAGPPTPGNHRVADFSSRGVDVALFEARDEVLEVSAPGRNILSTWPGGGYARAQGTSMAAPHVAGLAAHLWPRTLDRNGDGTRADEVRAELQRRAPRFDVTLGAHARPGYDPAAGLGVPQLQPPRARIHHTPAVPNPGEAVTFRGDASTAPDSRIAAYAWDLDEDEAVDARGATVTWSFHRPGLHNVSLTVRDERGVTDTARTQVRVNAQPVPRFTYHPPVPLVGETVHLDASPSHDPDGRIVAYRWDLDDDGEPDAFGPHANTSFTEPGRHRVTLTAEDAAGATATTARGILVNDVPQVRLDLPARVAARTPVPLEATVVDEVGNATVTWTVDGTPVGNGPRVTHAFTPGEHRVEVVATDEYGARGNATATVTAGGTVTPRNPHLPLYLGTAVVLVAGAALLRAWRRGA